MFKSFTNETQNVYEFKSHKTHKLNQSNILRHHFSSGSSDSTLSDYYKFARINFYLSGSDYTTKNPLFNNVPTIGDKKEQSGIFLNKFYETGSICFISQSKFGDGIKKGSFSLEDNSTASTIKIVDDSKGNLYSTNATFSQSVSALSSSDNYVGNVFYDIGAFTITETASFNGSVDYLNVTSGNYSLEYQGTNTITTYEWTCDALPNELNNTTNATVFHTNGRGQLKDNLTSSYFPTYISEVGLYDDQNTLMGYAKLSKPIPKSTKIPMKFFVRIDY
jgi:hypothetical protein|tara:strand:- start:25 stop:855 length:831 start_codon:yes stop_codon:yes gene_type:complete